ncbi:hypothetical protein ACVBEF_03995 [Glaciimonas sp. GG7]
MLKIAFKHALLLCVGTVLVAACSPKFNWRQVQGNDAPFSVLLPAKASTFSREVDLNGVKVNMTMTATEIDDTVFAVGSAKISDPSQAAAALQTMKSALVKNINGSITSETDSDTVGGRQDSALSITLEAAGAAESNSQSNSQNNSQPKALFAHLQSKGDYIYQVIVIGPQKTVKRENVEMFIESFKAS